MNNHDLRKLLRIGVVLSYIFLVLFAFTAVSFGSADADPYFQLKAISPFYWLGVITSVSTLLLSVFGFRSDNNQAIAAGLLSLVALTIFTNSIPRLLYENPIWMDTYSFVGETLDIILSGHIGWGESTDVPGISLFASQMSMITGSYYTFIASILPSILSVIMVLMVYSIAQVFISKRGAVFAGFIYTSLYYIGFYFNRRCFSLPFQLLVWYAMAQFMLGKRQRSWFAVAVFSFAALVVSHPATSFLVAVNAFAPVLLCIFIRIAGWTKLVKLDNFSILQKVSLSKSFLTSFLFTFMWIFWYTLHPGKKDVIQGIISQTIIALNQISSSPSPTSGIVANISGYSADYFSIVALRFGDVLFVSLFGIAVAFIYLINKKYTSKSIIVASWFLTDISLSVYVLYSFRTAWSDMPFRYALPAFATFLSWFIIYYRPDKRILGKIMKLSKFASFGLVIVFVFSLPLTMYSHAAFVYPPSTNVDFNMFLTKYGQTSSTVIGGHMEIDYFHFVNEKYNPPLIYRIYGTGFEATDFHEYDIIAWSFRAYVKDAFNTYSPTLKESLLELEGDLTSMYFAEIYVVPQHKIFVRQFPVLTE